MIKNIATVGVYVEDQQAAKKFWTEKVGFKLVAEREMMPGNSWLEVAPEGAESALVIYPRSLMTNWAELRPSIVFVCDDVEKTFADMKARGVQFESELQKMKWGTFARFNDEDGNTFLIKG